MLIESEAWTIHISKFSLLLLGKLGTIGAKSMRIEKEIEWMKWKSKMC